ncbi:MAG: M20/M25/M40 family metallo-hydrolase [Bryobacteraceae bacterium]
MNVFELTRALIDIESVTPNEERVGNFLFDRLAQLAEGTLGHVERMEAAPRRFNIFAHWDEPIVTFSTHIDTVPPFFPSREDDDFIWGRGACDTKGIIASMLFALEALLASGERRVAVLLVVGEERDSAGAFHAAKNPRGSRYLINGEPTENKLALGSKGALRFEIYAHGRMAHSAYPELGESAIEKLLDVLERVRKMKLPRDPLLGASTVNIGTIEGGRAPNVIADRAKAEVFFRLIDDGAPLRAAMQQAAGNQAELIEKICIPALRLRALDGIETTVVSFTTDIPAFGGAWGEPFLIGPGSIHLAHTDRERIPKAEILAAIQIYQKIAKELLK